MTDDYSGKTVAVIGLGYVGLPLALAFGRVMPTIGFDQNTVKIDHYLSGRDPSDEARGEDFTAARHIEFTTDCTRLTEADFLIVTVPTPIDTTRQPDLSALRAASRTIGQHHKPGAAVIYESTVYPGVTEEICGPLIEEHSSSSRGRDFKLAYSPERINPGDREHRLQNIVKVVAGEDADTLDAVAGLYGLIVKAGIARAESIQVAEAAKVIENIQRDLNIALMNELAVLFDRLGLDTQAVLRAAATKWNFKHYKPGLVGGHCISVDPYYLTYRAQEIGHHPQVILAGRRINDSMGEYVAQQTVKQMIHNGNRIQGSVVLIMGLTFKANCPDLRNSRVVDIVRELESYGVDVRVWDPLADPELAKAEYQVDLMNTLGDNEKADAIIAAVDHDGVKNLTPREIAQHKTHESAVFMDVKGVFDRDDLTRHGFLVWRL